MENVLFYYILIPSDLPKLSQWKIYYYSIAINIFQGDHIKLLEFQQLLDMILCIFSHKNQATLKYPIKEHALLLIFNILPPLLAFFHPARLLIFRKISTLLVYSIPARLFHPACYFHPALLDYFFFIKKNIYTLFF